MKKTVRILIGTGLCVLLLIAWFIAANSNSKAENQLILINQATELINDGIYVRAVPLLEEAAGYDATHTITAERELKRAYLALIDSRGFSRRYTELLGKQMNRRDAEPHIFIEAANYYLSISKTQEALAVLRNGMERTGDASIIALYENARYVFETSRTSYDYASAIFEETVQVQTDGKWGIANADGTVIIDCQYGAISTFSADRAIVRNGSSVYAVDMHNNRIAVTRENVLDFGNFAENRIALFVDGGWRRATGEFELGANSFEYIGMYSGGYAAAKTGGKWGVIDLNNNWLIEPEYDAIVQDELGRCYAQGAVFIRDGEVVYLFTNGELTKHAYEDAHSFSDEGYAAVKRNGKWGFIDTHGVEVIPCVFDDALSFGQHLAAVKIGEFWGYISLSGQLVIDAAYYEAKSFSDGSAPVLTDRGWQFITLLEFKRSAAL